MNNLPTRYGLRLKQHVEDHSCEVIMPRDVLMGKVKVLEPGTNLAWLLHEFSRLQTSNPLPSDWDDEKLVTGKRYLIDSRPMEILEPATRAPRVPLLLKKTVDDKGKPLDSKRVSFGQQTIVIREKPSSKKNSRPLTWKERREARDNVGLEEAIDRFWFDKRKNQSEESE